MKGEVSLLVLIVDFLSSAFGEENIDSKKLHFAALLNKMASSIKGFEISHGSFYFSSIWSFS